MSFRPAPAYRRWPIAVAGAATGAVITALVAAVIVSRHQAETATKPPAPATVTVTPSPPPTPAPLPSAQADRHTCNAWLTVGKHVDAASAALETLPKGMTIMDPQVRANPDLSALVSKAATEYNEAADTLAAGIAPGTTVILNLAATTAAGALHALATGDSTYDVANGNTFHTWKEAAGTVNVLCARLAPR